VHREDPPERSLCSRRAPQRGRLFVAQTGEPATSGRVDVHEGGELVFVTGSSGEADYTSLDTISFDTD
jgi:hypothetical protein